MSLSCCHLTSLWPACSSRVKCYIFSPSLPFPNSLPLFVCTGVHTGPALRHTLHSPLLVSEQPENCFHGFSFGCGDIYQNPKMSAYGQQPLHETSCSCSDIHQKAFCVPHKNIPLCPSCNPIPLSHSPTDMNQSRCVMQPTKRCPGITGSSSLVSFLIFGSSPSLFPILIVCFGAIFSLP